MLSSIMHVLTLPEEMIKGTHRELKSLVMIDWLILVADTKRAPAEFTTTFGVKEES